ncbi:hypothetical protein GCM10009765_25480 [Fodinicola feengrottensis]|uniref:Metallo-beta-lactamase domain-containing protein n=1 Tax=Fodinicola feengrottensis TaxID=435914 RepID=A0ABN2GQB8_9ACTN
MLPELTDGVLVLDSEMAGDPDHNGVFLLTGSRPALVESGVGLAGERVAEALTALGIGPGDLAAIVVTHVHLDHAGGAGELARRFPSATVMVHPSGAKHLVDPSRLEASARQVHGPLMDTVYGHMTPIPADRIRVLADGDTVDLGERQLTALHTPGHAPHHVAVLDTSDGTLFTGDAAGVRLPEMRTPRPSTPPPSFSAADSRASLDRMAALAPARLVLTHFGVVTEPLPYLADLTDRLGRWCAAAEKAVADGQDAAALEAELLRLFGAEEGLPLENPARFASTGGYSANAAGLHLWATRQLT